ncbi:MAG TPA: hypothetical protein VKG38_00590 [Solirubrobacteraceae bacterium]|nr:hypothetical protein [Solirubrobacteraceae bacterium]
MPDEQDTPLGRHGAQRVEGLRGIEALSQWRVLLQRFALLLAPGLRGQFRGLARTRLGAEEHRIEGRIEPRQGDARCACLGFAPSRQPAIGIGARAVRLGLCMT